MKGTPKGKILQIRIKDVFYVYEKKLEMDVSKRKNNVTISSCVHIKYISE